MSLLAALLATGYVWIINPAPDAHMHCAALTADGAVMIDGREIAADQQAAQITWAARDGGDRLAIYMAPRGFQKLIGASNRIFPALAVYDTPGTRKLQLLQSGSSDCADMTGSTR